MNTLQELQKWYHSQCDSAWEHVYGVEIFTLDNPGWHVAVDLVNTDLAERPFTEVLRPEHETDWIDCRVRNGKWEGHGGPLMLEEIPKTFLAWAAERPTA